MKGGAKATFGATAIIIWAVVLIFVLGLAGWGIRVYFAEEIGKGNAEIQIQSASSRISRYESFYNQCNSLVALEVQIDRESERTKNIANPDARAIAESTLSGLYGQHARGAANYNADASKNYTSAQFLASDLPYYIEPAYEANGVKTSCGR